MDEALRTQFKEFSDANRDAWAKVKALVRRKDRPATFRAWTPALNDEFDRNPDEAEYAIYLWELEAESRVYDLEPVLEPLYFTGLSRTLTCYADHLGLNTTNSLLEFARWTSTGQNRELRAPFDDDGISLIIDSENDLIRLKAAISAKSYALGNGEGTALPSNEVAVQREQSDAADADTPRWSRFRPPKEWRRLLSDYFGYDVKPRTFSRHCRNGKYRVNPEGTSKNVSLDLRQLPDFNDSQ